MKHETKHKAKYVRVRCRCRLLSAGANIIILGITKYQGELFSLKVLYQGDLFPLTKYGTDEICIKRPNGSLVETGVGEQPPRQSHSSRQSV
jgi:hypothetical protein